MKLTSLTSVMRAACGGSTRSSSRAAYSPPNPPPAMTILHAMRARLPPLAVFDHRARREVSGRTRDGAAGVRARPREVQAVDPAEAARTVPVGEHLPGQHL